MEPVLNFADAIVQWLFMYRWPQVRFALGHCPLCIFNSMRRGAHVKIEATQPFSLSGAPQIIKNNEHQSLC